MLDEESMSMENVDGYGLCGGKRRFAVKFLTPQK
jgi:hypothetical protein